MIRAINGRPARSRSIGPGYLLPINYRFYPESRQIFDNRSVAHTKLWLEDLSDPQIPPTLHHHTSKYSTGSSVIIPSGTFDLLLTTNVANSAIRPLSAARKTEESLSSQVSYANLSLKDLSVLQPVRFGTSPHTRFFTPAHPITTRIYH